MISLQRSGVNAGRRSDRIMVLMPTDLPDPVVPAIKQMRHAGEIGENRLATDILAECHSDRF